MKIDKDFISGNIEVLQISETEVRLEREFKDTNPIKDWFYWAFRVTEAAGKTVTFLFPHVNRVGYWGAAVSHDLTSWHWSGSREVGTDENGDPYESFTYTFGEDENEVYFAYTILYLPHQFDAFCEKNGLPVEEFCISNKGRSVPCTRFGHGDKSIILASRHHACESTGTYVMESVMQSLLDEPLEGYEIFCVPFVDYDGVVDGDQGKHRLPHDHNRDYFTDGRESLYHTCAAMRRYADEHQIVFAFDFHAPKHLSGINDKVHIVYNLEENIPLFKKFAHLLERNITPDAIAYDSINDVMPNDGWNQSSNPTYARYMTAKPENHLAFTLETPYFGEADGSVVINQDTLKALGKSFARALREYIASME